MAVIKERYIKNSVWMIVEQVFKIIVSYFLIIIIARQLGPEDFGNLNFAIAVTTIVMAVSRMGLEFTLVREIACFPEKAVELRSSAIIILCISSISGFLLLFFSANIFPIDSINYLTIIFVGLGVLALPLSVIDYYFQAMVKARYSTAAKVIGLMFSFIIKSILIWNDAGLIYFALSFGFDYIFLGVALYFLYKYKEKKNHGFKFCLESIKKLVSSSWPMLISAVSISLYTKVDQIMIDLYLGSAELGFYAASTRLYDGLNLIPYVISVSFIPWLASLKELGDGSYEEFLTKIFSCFFWGGICISIIFACFSEKIIYFSYGDEYKSSSVMPFIIIIFGLAFSAIGSMSARYLSVENLEKKIAKRTFFGLLINVFLNMFFIPFYGISGAAFSSLLTIVVINFIVNYFDHELKPLVKILNDSVFKVWSLKS